MANTGWINASNAYIKFRAIDNVTSIGNDSFTAQDMGYNGGSAEMEVDIDDALIGYGTINSVTISYTCYGERTNSLYKKATARTGYRKSGTSYNWCHTHTEEVGRGSSNKTPFTDTFTPYRATDDNKYHLAISARNHIAALKNTVYFSGISIYIDYTPKSYTITATASPAEGGSVSGSGTYSQGSTATLTATANTDYRFKQWQDGNTSNPRSVTVSGDATYTAEFEKTSFTISGTVSPANSGTVDGARSYTYGDTATLTAIPNEGYDFVKWSDGITDNPRTFTVTGAATFVAEFKLKTFVVSVRADTGFQGVQLGTVTGAGVYEYGQQATLMATPLVEGWLKFEFFYSESPEDYDAIYKDNPFIFTVTNNRNLCAKFAYISQALPLYIPVYENSYDNAIYYGTAWLTYKEPIEIPEPPVKEDTDQYHYEFDGWYSRSGNKLPLPADIIGYDTPIEKTTYYAHFTKTLKKYVVTTVATKGSITGVESGSSYEYGTTLALTAVPNKGHEFLYWMIVHPDGSYESLYDKSIEITVTDNIEILAAFRKFRPRITSTQLLYSNKQISANNKVPVGEYFRIVVGVESYD